MTTDSHRYAARMDIDYPEQLDRFTTFVRLIWAIPIVIILSLLSAAVGETVVTKTGEEITKSGGGIASGLAVATMLMIVFRQRYPRWWFDFARELTRFSARRGSGLTSRFSPIGIPRLLTSSRYMSKSTTPTSGKTSIAGCLW